MRSVQLEHWRFWHFQCMLGYLGVAISCQTLTWITESLTYVIFLHTCDVYMLGTSVCLIQRTCKACTEFDQRNDKSEGALGQISGQSLACKCNSHPSMWPPTLPSGDYKIINSSKGITCSLSVISEACILIRLNRPLLFISFLHSDSQSELTPKFYNSSRVDIEGNVLILTSCVLRFDQTESFWMPTHLVKFHVHSLHLLRKKLRHLAGSCHYFI